jgi:hypothetical protein
VPAALFAAAKSAPPEAAGSFASARREGVQGVKTVRCCGGETKDGPLGAKNSERRSGPGPGRLVDLLSEPTPPGPWRTDARALEEARARVAERDGRALDREGEAREGLCGLRWGLRDGEDGVWRERSKDVVRDVSRSENVFDFRRARGK